jgi:hypothetical protein
MKTKQGKFLVARYSLRPKYPSVSKQKGWMNNPENISWDEQVGFYTRMRDRDLSQWNIILDLVERQVLVCRSPAGQNSVTWGEKPDFESLYTYFYKNYQKQIDQFSPPAPAQ